MATATTGFSTLSLHDALPIWVRRSARCELPRLGGSQLDSECGGDLLRDIGLNLKDVAKRPVIDRSEDHTSELQSHVNLVCRLLLEKKKHKRQTTYVPLTIQLH